MSRKPAVRLDASAAWNAWTTSGSPEAAAQFLDCIGSWTEGTAAQLTRGAAHHFGCHPTREDITARLRQELGRARFCAPPVPARRPQNPAPAPDHAHQLAA